jgi:hypothetical protein
VPGLGSLATGDRRGGLACLVGVGGAALAVAITLPYADGTWVGVPFLAGAALATAWIGQAVVAWRRAAGRAARLGRDTGDGLVLLAAVVVSALAATSFWSVAGDGASAAARTSAYVTAWRQERVEAARSAMSAPPDVAVLAAAWARQSARLRTIASVAAAADPSAGIDPDRPFSSVRSTEVGASPGSADGQRTVRLDLVRHESVPSRVLGLSTRTTRLVTLAELGTIELRLVETPHPIALMPPVRRWTIVRVDLLGESLGG